MTEKAGKGSTFDLSRFERRVLPPWLFDAGREEDKRITILIHTTIFIAIITLTFQSGVAFFQRYTTLGLADLLMAVALAGVLLYSRKSTVHLQRATLTGVSIYGLFCFYLFFTGGAGSATFVWYYTFPLMVSFILGSRRGLIASVLLLLPAILLLILERHIPSFTPYPLSIKVRFVPSFIVVLGLSYLYERIREATHRQLDHANAQLRESYEEVEQRVKEGTAELHQANQHLQKEIQDRILAEEQRRQAEEMFRTMAENSRAGVVIIQDDRFVYLNHNAAQYAGYSVEELTGFEASRFIHPADVESLKQNMAEMLRGERSAPYEYRIVRKDGGVRWILETLTSITYQGKRAILGNSMDVTERKEVEARLRESEEKYRFLTEKMSDIVWTVDLGMNTNYVSPSIAKVLGFSPEERRMQSLHEQVTPESYHYVMSVFAQEIERDKEKGVDPDRTLMLELEFYRKDGSTVWLENVVNPIRDGEGNILGIYGVSRDITKRKVLEGQLLQAQKMEAIGTLAGGIAHDFNNLLFGVLGHVSLMESDAHVTQDQKERLAGIGELVKSASGLTSQILGFARKGRYEVVTTNMNELLEKASTMFGRARKDITIHKEFSENLMPVEADRTQLEQVFMNLFVNAGQAMPGGGSLYIDTTNVTIQEDDPKYVYLPLGRYVKLSVTDTGTGMDEATKNRIFEPFFTTKEMGRGTGLGLATVYGIVKGHNGHIEVYSDSELGTTFNVFLPVSKREVIREHQPAQELQAGHETILVVDDEKIVTTITRDILERLGYQVLVADSGQEAIEVYRANRERIALVILDLVMPVMGGNETFDRLKEINPDIRVILSSGYSINGEAQEVMDKGCRAFIQKPISMADLSWKVRGALERQ